MGSGFRIVDNAVRWNRVRREVAAFKRQGLEVGVFDDSPRPGESISNAEALALLEFGTPTSPRRPVLTGALESNRAKNTVLLAQLTAGVLDDSMTARAALETWGLAVVAQIQEKMRVGPWPPNAPATVARKGSSRPTIDTEQLLRAFAFRVVSR